VFIFYNDGAFALKKIEQYGSGEYYTSGSYLFYFTFNSGAGADIQFVQGTGIFMNGPNRKKIIGLGTIMAEYSSLPFVFCGIEVFQ
jgi:hypothetical protein